VGVKIKKWGKSTPPLFENSFLKSKAFEKSFFLKSKTIFFVTNRK